MSSNFCSRPIDWSHYGVVYAGAQKNLGPAGVCVAVIREDLLGKKKPETPLLCDWTTYSVAPQTFHNTPCCWSIYMAGLNLEHMLDIGMDKIEELANTRSKMLYDFIDGSDGFYINGVAKQYRSRMNIPFRVKKDDALEAKFISEATAAGLIDLKGHRSVGGCRASIYNAMPVAGVETLIKFMTDFKAANQ